MNVLFATLVLTAYSLPCNETYQISGISHKLGQLPTIHLALLDNYVLPPIKSALGPTHWELILFSIIEFVLPYAFLVMVFGPIFLILFAIAVIVQATCKCCSNPFAKYWSYSLLFSRVCLVIGSFGISMVSAFGLFTSREFSGALPGPFVSVVALARGDSMIITSLWDTVQSVANKSSFPVPDATRTTIETFIAQFELETEFLNTLVGYVHLISRYTNSFLLIVFGLIIFLCVMSTINAFSKKNQSCPKWTITAIMIAVLVLMSVSAVSASIALVVSRECDKGIDNVVNDILENHTDISSCQAGTWQHFLYCKPWPNVTDISCTNPFARGNAFAHEVLEFIQFLPDSDDEVKQINNALNQFFYLESCNETSQVYQQVKSTFCWSINNQAIWMTAIIFFQAPFLALLLFYALFAWNAFANGYDVLHYTKGPHQVTHHVETTSEDESASAYELADFTTTIVTTTDTVEYPATGQAYVQVPPEPDDQFIRVVPLVSDSDSDQPTEPFTRVLQAEPEPFTREPEPEPEPFTRILITEPDPEPFTRVIVTEPEPAITILVEQPVVLMPAPQPVVVVPPAPATKVYDSFGTEQDKGSSNMQACCVDGVS